MIGGEAISHISWRVLSGCPDFGNRMQAHLIEGAWLGKAEEMVIFPLAEAREPEDTASNVGI